jgi:hypothetical protein
MSEHKLFSTNRHNEEISQFRPNSNTPISKNDIKTPELTTLDEEFSILLKTINLSRMRIEYIDPFKKNTRVYHLNSIQITLGPQFSFCIIILT